MGKENTCKAVPNHGLPDKVRTACSVCGAIWDDSVRGSCCNCHRRIKKSKFSNKHVINI